MTITVDPYMALASLLRWTPLESGRTTEQLAFITALITRWNVSCFSYDHPFCLHRNECIMNDHCVTSNGWQLFSRTLSRSVCLS